MQKKSSKLTQEVEKTGLKINIQKTKLLEVHTTQQAKVQLKGKDIDTFTYLERVVTDKEEQMKMSKTVLDRPSMHSAF